MVRIIEKEGIEKTIGFSDGQKKTIAQAVTKIVGITIAENSEGIEKLLKSRNIPLPESATEKALIEATIEQLSRRDPQFNLALEQLILEAIPALRTIEQYDHFGESTDPFGSGVKLFGNSGLGGIGGNSGVGKLVDGARTIGTSTASGAAGGGIVGAALGALGGIFGLATSAKQEKIEKQKASDQTLSDMLRYRASLITNQGLKLKNRTNLGIAALLIVGIIVAVIVYRNRKKAKE